MSLCPDSGYFPLAWCRTFCMLSASMQIPPGHSCKKMQTTLSLTLSPPPHAFSPPSPRWLYGCSLFDVFPSLNAPPRRCLLLSPVLLFLLPSFLSPFLPSLPLRRLLSGVSSRLTSLAVTLDFKELLHSSVTHQREGAIQRHAKREGGDEEWVYKKIEGERVYERRARERKRIRSWPRGTSGSHNNKIKKKKRNTLPHSYTPIQSHTRQFHTLFFCVCVVFVLLGVFRCLTHDPFLFFFFPFSPVDLSSFYLLHSFHLSRQYKRGMLRPVPSRNPSLHLCVRVCVCVSFFFPNLFYTLPYFLNLAFCIFIAFVLTDILPLFFFSFFSPRSSVFWGGWQASFQVSGNCYCFPSQLESGSHSTAHKHTHTHTQRNAHFFFFSSSALSPSLCASGLYGHVVVWSCIHGCLACKRCTARRCAR